MIKALFFDLDGTLLTSDKQLLSSSQMVLKKCHERGIKSFIATARSPMLDRMLCWNDDNFSLFDGGIYCNGACIVTDRKKEYAYLQENTVSYCVKQTKLYADLHISLHLKDEIHAFNHNLPDSVLDFWGLRRDEIISLDENCFAHTAKILIYYGNLADSAQKIPNEFYDDLKNHCSEDTNIYLTDNAKTIQVVAKNVSKYSAIEKLRLELGLEKDEIAVFGDDINDIEMLSGYRNSIAMGNAENIVKQAAAHTTKTNDENGISFALEEILHLLG